MDHVTLTTEVMAAEKLHFKIHSNRTKLFEIFHNIVVFNVFFNLLSIKDISKTLKNIFSAQISNAQVSQLFSEFYVYFYGEWESDTAHTT